MSPAAFSLSATVSTVSSEETSTTISTGGFSVKNASIAAYNSLTINWIIIIFMFLSGVNFSLLYYALCRNFKAVLHSEELRLYTLLTIGASALIAANLVAVGGRP